jgi:hypothetical protein
VKLKPPKPGEQRYAVAIRDGADLRLMLWIRYSEKDEIFVMLPGLDWEQKASYHDDGEFHTEVFHRNSRRHIKWRLPPKRGLSRQLLIQGMPKPLAQILLLAKPQPLTADFKGIQHAVTLYGQGFGAGVVWHPTDFNEVVYVEPGILGPRDGSVAVDVVEPGYKLKPKPGGPMIRMFYRGPLPSVVISICPANQEPVGLKWPDHFVKVE